LAEERLRAFLIGLGILVWALVSSTPAQRQGASGNVGVGLIDTYRFFDHPIDPTTYLIRPGDRLVVTFIKAKLAPLRLTVNPEGKIINATLGSFDLSGKTLQQAKEILRGTLQELYNVDEIAISVSEPLKVSIPVSGAVQSPGLYTAYTSQRVSEIIDSAGGVLPAGSRRTIIFSGGPQDIIVDLDRADFLGDNAANPCLYAGYAVHVPGKSERVVQVVGEVNHPREIELLPDDDLKLLLELAGGTRSSADLDAIRILGGSGEDRGSGAAVQAGDIIWVPPKQWGADSGRVIVFGAVARPGKYEYKNGLTLPQLLEESGGFTVSANPLRTTVFRRVEVDQWGRVSTERYPISGVVVGNGDIKPVSLQPGDSVFVPLRVGYVKVSGAVLNPGLFPFHEGGNALSYIKAAGGFLPTADKDMIHLFNRISKVTSAHPPDVLVHDGDEIIVNVREELK
jgi:protein involved in polysaccharide export with SLBB domain